MKADRRDTAWVRRYWDRSAAGYDRGIGTFERTLLRDGRQWVASRARGDVLEVGIGTGRSLGEYPAEVRLTGIDLSAGMLDQARARARELGRAVTLVAGDAEHLDLADASFDTVVFCLALCSIPDDGAAVREAKRVLRPGGRVVLVEHVRSPNVAVRTIERGLNAFTTRFQADDLLREPLDHLRADGFAIEELERSRLGIIERLAARKPA